MRLSGEIALNRMLKHDGRSFHARSLRSASTLLYSAPPHPSDISAFFREGESFNKLHMAQESAYARFPRTIGKQLEFGRFGEATLPGNTSQRALTMANFQGSSVRQTLRSHAHRAYGRHSCGICLPSRRRRRHCFLLQATCGRFSVNYDSSGAALRFTMRALGAYVELHHMNARPRANRWTSLPGEGD